MRNDRVIARKLRHLKMIPDVARTGGFAEEKKRRALTRRLIVNFDISISDKKHLSLPAPKLHYDRRKENAMRWVWRLTLFRVL